tara:strand:- start:1020 stop:1451 length:432 start_codon:yes stop_codon:yes gene_type:complete
MSSKFPPCFNNKKEYQNYLRLVAKAKEPNDPNNYCMDCTRDYKIKMLREKRCSHPETIFVEWKKYYKELKHIKEVSVRVISDEGEVSADNISLTTEGEFHTTREEPDEIGLSELSVFWSLAKHDKLSKKELDEIRLKATANEQ